MSGTLSRFQFDQILRRKRRREKEKEERGQSSQECDDPSSHRPTSFSSFLSSSVTTPKGWTRPKNDGGYQNDGAHGESENATGFTSGDRHATRNHTISTTAATLPTASAVKSMGWKTSLFQELPYSAVPHRPAWNSVPDFVTGRTTAEESVMTSPTTSSITCSQSPTLVRRPPPPRPRAYQDHHHDANSIHSDNSSEDEDLVAFSRAIERSKKGEKNVETATETPSSRLRTSEHSSFVENDARKSLGFSNSAQDAGDDDDDDDEKLIQWARKMEAEKVSQKPLDASHSPIRHDESKKRPARNPLALFKEEQRQALEKVNQVMLSVAHRHDQDEEDAWWGKDSDDERDRSKNRHKETTTTTPGLPKSNNREASGSRQSTGRRKQNLSDLGDWSEDDPEQLQADLKPYFEEPFCGPFALKPLVLGCDVEDDYQYEVPASINRYLLEYQRQGIDFVFQQVVVKKRGAILGDDMGLGKTIQMISFLAALLQKQGNGLDLLELNRRKKAVKLKLDEIQLAKEEALQRGEVRLGSDKVVLDVGVPKWAPILIVAPPAVVENWRQDSDRWGHFGLAIYHGKEREVAFNSVENGSAEILLCARSFFAKDDVLVKLLSVHWKLIIIDEFHLFKNSKGIVAKNLRSLKDVHKSIVIGLTGTLMQNDHKELWNLVDLVSAGFLGSEREFLETFSRPIMAGRTTDATSFAKEMGKQKSLELSTKLLALYIGRTKEEVLRDELPEKDERIVFCELSPLQKTLYQHIMQQADFQLLAKAYAPCECGVNQKFFLGYQALKTKEERIEYQRRNKHLLTFRSKCCFKIPVQADSPDGIDESAVLWRQQHKELVPCDKCPSCIGFAAVSLLYKLSAHASLLQVQRLPDDLEEGSEAFTEATRLLNRAKVFLPKEFLPQLPGKSYLREDGIMDNHFALSGKMIVLDKLLKSINSQRGRVLLFSASVQSLNLIQNFVRSRGYSFLRMDGTTSTKTRVELVEKFQSDESVFMFLLSTKATGLGINLTKANFVIIFDVEWNPSYDAQAQDRAFRIGQTKDVKVFRFVARGTVEELKYLRQVYKIQLKSETIVDVESTERRIAARLFRGVAGDHTRKGELFGFANLLKFKDGTFMKYASEAKESKQFGVGVLNCENLLKSVQGMTPEELDAVGDNVFDDLARLTVADDQEAAIGPLSAEDIGGESQAIMEVSDKALVQRGTEVEEEAHPSTLDMDMERKELLDMAIEMIDVSATVPASCEQLEQKDGPHQQEDKSNVIDLCMTAEGDARSSPTNALVVGKSLRSIRRNHVATTFSVLDLYRPS